MVYCNNLPIFTHH